MPGGNKPDTVISLHRPFHEAEPLGIAADFQLHVPRQRVGRAVEVDGQGVIEHHVDRNFRPDRERGIAEPLHRSADGREIAKQRDAGGAIENDAADGERNFAHRAPRAAATRRDRAPAARTPAARRNFAQATPGRSAATPAGARYCRSPHVLERAEARKSGVFDPDPRSMSRSQSDFQRRYHLMVISEFRCRSVSVDSVALDDSQPFLEIRAQDFREFLGRRRGCNADL